MSPGLENHTQMMPLKPTDQHKKVTMSFQFIVQTSRSLKEDIRNHAQYEIKYQEDQKDAPAQVRVHVNDKKVHLPLNGNFVPFIATPQTHLHMYMRIFYEGQEIMPFDQIKVPICIITPEWTDTTDTIPYMRVKTRSLVYKQAVEFDLYIIDGEFVLGKLITWNIDYVTLQKIITANHFSYKRRYSPMFDHNRKEDSEYEFELAEDYEYQVDKAIQPPTAEEEQAEKAVE